MLTAERLREVLRYDPGLGSFTWLARGDADWATQVWNKRWAGKEAGYNTPRGYRIIRVDVRRYVGSRLAWIYMTGAWPAQEIDHRNGISGDDRWENLREASRTQNMQNRATSPRNKLETKGVYLECGRKGKAYVASIGHVGRVIHIGRFATAEEAHAAYADLAQKLHRDFARLS